MCTDESALDIEFLRTIDYAAKTFQLCDANGDGLDYTGYTIDADARRTPDSEVAFAMGVAWVDEATGLYSITRTDTETAAMEIGEYGYDVVVTTALGVRLPPVATGKVTVRNVYTQS